ncbi:glycosyltransferase [Pseudoxanthomonas beigongshangi]
MRFLLVAYDFPPIPSPQSLRWAYLVNELAAAGHEVHVLTPDIEGYGTGGLPVPHAGVYVHRVWPGPFSAWRTWRIRRRRVNRTPQIASVDPPAAPGAAIPQPAALNWKGKLRRFLGQIFRTGPVLAGLARRCGLELPIGGSLTDLPRAIAGLWMYPDVRAEWWPWARWKLLRLLARFEPDFVVTSHEPANSLPLGMLAARRGYRWVADLGDPVLSPYTPARWRKHAEALERMVCTQADLITVTAAGARDTLVRRHGVAPEKFMIATQGHAGDQAGSPENRAVMFDRNRLELFYTGSFYSFRTPDELVSAVVRANGARLSVASINPPADLIEAARRHPTSIRLLGFVPHATAVRAQRECDLLVNLANTDPIQVPGKLFEYLGACRPILHIGGSGEDESGKIVVQTGSGWSLPNNRQAILDFLGEYDKERGDELMAMREKAKIDEYSWKSVAHRLVAQLQCMHARAPRAEDPQQYMHGA